MKDLRRALLGSTSHHAILAHQAASKVIAARREARR